MWKSVGAGPPWYLKAAPVSAGLHLDREAARLRWMHARQLLAPAVIRYMNAGESEYLLAEEAAGLPASAPEWSTRQADVAIALGKCLAELNLGPQTVAPFLASYGWPSINPRTTEFFTVIDEFFQPAFLTTSSCGGC